jgi:hypothetical protein
MESTGNKMKFDPNVFIVLGPNETIVTCDIWPKRIAPYQAMTISSHVVGISILPLSTIFIFDIIIVLTVWLFSFLLNVVFI